MTIFGAHLKNQEIVQTLCIAGLSLLGPCQLLLTNREHQLEEM